MLKDNDSVSFAAAVDYEKRLQWAYKEATALHSIPFLHASLKPLGEVEFKDAKRQKDMFNNECEGICGV